MKKETEINRQCPLEEMMEIVHRNAKEKGFHNGYDNDSRFIDAQTNNLHDEVSELHEAWRQGKFEAYCDKADAMIDMGLTGLTCSEEEYADIVIRVFDQCQRLKIDLVNAIIVKHEYNKTRSQRHGNKLS